MISYFRFVSFSFFWCFWKFHLKIHTFYEFQVCVFSLWKAIFYFAYQFLILTHFFVSVKHCCLPFVCGIAASQRNSFRRWILGWKSSLLFLRYCLSKWLTLTESFLTISYGVCKLSSHWYEYFPLTACVQILKTNTQGLLSITIL